MASMMRGPWYVLPILVVALLGARALAVHGAPARSLSETSTIGQGARDFADLSARFTKLAQQRGAIYAFQILKLAQLPANTDVHLLGHAIGDELYKQKGPAGMADCTQDFRNACSHAIAIGALDEYGGEKAISLIQSACEKAPGGSGAYTMCFHGLGHGVFAFYEYDLSKTVAFCQKSATRGAGGEEYPQCVGGAIMELADGGGHDHDAWLAAQKKYFDPSDPLAPCDRGVIPQDVKNFCYMYLTPHLFASAGADLGAPDPSTFAKAFGFCDAISVTQQRLRDACFGSFGKEFIPLAGARDIRGVDHYSDDEYQIALSWCALSPTRDGYRACVQEELDSVFWGGENDPSASLRLCSLAGDSATKSGCYDELAIDISLYLPKRTDLCGMLPVQSRALCTPNP